MIYYLAGLPRSGSTAIAAILAQNPHFHVSATSAVLPIMMAAANAYHQSPQTVANSVKGQCAAMLRGLVSGMYAHADRPVVIDKSRGWANPDTIKILTEVYGRSPKILCPVRPIAEILASFVALMRDNPKSVMEKEVQSLGFPLSDAGRCKYLMSEKGVVFQAWSGMKAAVDAGFGDCLHFIEYDDFCRDPQGVMRKVYEFLGEEPFEHSFDRVENVVPENDIDAYGIKGLHEIRGRVDKTSRPAVEVLGDRLYSLYQGGEFWNDKPEPVHEPQIIDLQLAASLRGDFEAGQRLADMAAPDDDRAQFNRGWYVLRQGRLQEGIRLLDRGRPEGIFGNPLPSDAPLYDGRKLHGETVVLGGEGGLGDQICGARFARDIAARGGKVVLTCAYELAPILASIPAVSSIVGRNVLSGVLHQFVLPAMSAPAALGLEYSDLDGSPYIPITAPRNPAEFRIGLRWAGNPQFEHEQHRRFDPGQLFDLPGTLVSLQRDWDGHVPDHVRQPDLSTWERTAIEIAKCDLIISSCTSVAHLAAAMGKPTWIIVPICPYYLWALPGEKSPWYASVTLFRQEAYGDWTSVFSRIHERLNADRNVSYG
jgi:sulfotransferase